MNIGVDIRVLNDREITGVGNYTLYALESITKLDNENNYHLLNTGWKDTLDKKLLQNISAEYNHYRCANKVINLRNVLGFGPDLVKKVKSDLDLFWLPNLNFFKFNKKVPTVLTIHDLSFLHTSKFYSSRHLLWHKLIKVRKLIRGANKIIAVSNNTKRDVMRYFGVREDKIAVVSPGVNVVKMDRKTAEELTKEFKLADHYFLYVGTLEPRKNIHAIITAFDDYHRKYPFAQLVIVGRKGWLYSGIMKEINNRKYIKYLGYVDSPSKDALYYLSQGLIWPSFYEGFGFPPLEATYHGIPVITSYKTSLPEIMKQQALYVDPYNSADIYQALVLLTENDKLREQLIIEAKRFKLPTWDEQAKKIINVFKEI